MVETIDTIAISKESSFTGSLQDLSLILRHGLEELLALYVVQWKPEFPESGFRTRVLSVLISLGVGEEKKRLPAVPLAYVPLEAVAAERDFDRWLYAAQKLREGGYLRRTREAYNPIEAYAIVESVINDANQVIWSHLRQAVNIGSAAWKELLTERERREILKGVSGVVEKEVVNRLIAELQQFITLWDMYAGDFASRLILLAGLSEMPFAKFLLRRHGVDIKQFLSRITEAVVTAILYDRVRDVWEMGGSVPTKSLSNLLEGVSITDVYGGGLRDYLARFRESKREKEEEPPAGYIPTLSAVKIGEVAQKITELFEKEFEKICEKELRKPLEGFFRNIAQYVFASPMLTGTGGKDMKELRDDYQKVREEIAESVASAYDACKRPETQEVALSGPSMDLFQAYKELEKGNTSGAREYINRAISTFKSNLKNFLNFIIYSPRDLQDAIFSVEKVDEEMLDSLLDTRDYLNKLEKLIAHFGTFPSFRESTLHLQEIRYSITLALSKVRTELRTALENVFKDVVDVVPDPASLESLVDVAMQPFQRLEEGLSKISRVEIPENKMNELVDLTASAIRGALGDLFLRTLDVSLVDIKLAIKEALESDVVWRLKHYGGEGT